MNSVKILVVDDDELILEMLVYNLKKEGFEVLTASDGKSAVDLAKEFKPDLILLDVMMPGQDGIEVCYQLRSQSENKDTLIVFSSARSEDFTQLSAYGAGADDYFVKPIKPKILISKIKAMLKRHVPSDSIGGSQTILSRGGVCVDKEAFTVTRDGDDINLVKKEFELLCLLLSKPGKVFRREEIINNVWGTEVVVGDRTIDVHIRKLREKIGSSYFKTIKGVGYKFVED